MEYIYNVSVIIPVFNVENYIIECLDSILIQNCKIEILVIDDSSTDSTLEILRRYHSIYNNVVILEQNHSGPSAARNLGLKYAKGEYIAFVDGDDWITSDSLLKVFDLAKQCDADMVLGSMIYHSPDTEKFNIYDIIPSELKNVKIEGTKCFINLMKTHSYYPMACSYIYKRKWLVDYEIKFEEGIIHEDELWTQKVLCLAKIVVISNLDFYNYRRRPGSIMTTLNNENRLKSLFLIASKIIEFAKLFEKDYILFGWICVNALRIYSLAYTILAKMNNSSFIVPDHYQCNYNLFQEVFSDESKERCEKYCTNIRNRINEYKKWKNNVFDLYLSNNVNLLLENKRIVLIYNNPSWNSLGQLRYNSLPNNYFITFDRKYYDQAFAVVFHLPDLHQSVENDLIKIDGQIWILWNMESEENFKWMKDKQFCDLFDLKMDYHQNSDINIAYYNGIKRQVIKRHINLSQKKNKICMLISSLVNQSKRIEYIEELMKYIDIDSYGKLFNNKVIGEDYGEKTKLKIYSEYKFSIAFENAIENDYITEKIYDQLVAGSVPIYLGAPNVGSFLPGENCLINTNSYRSPKDLAYYLKKCLINDDEYLKYHEWRKYPFFRSFVEKEKIQNIHLFIRLCMVLDEKYS